jgi:hypothetical protein
MPQSYLPKAYVHGHQELIYALGGTLEIQIKCRSDGTHRCNIPPNPSRE